VASPVVFADNSSIIFSWEDDRRSEGWDIYAKLVNWNWNGVTAVIDEGNINPKDFSLSQNYPNPFNPTTKIRFTIPTSPLNPSPYQGEGKRERFVTLKVYDVLGNEVAKLANEELAAGEYGVTFDAGTSRDLSLQSGVYFYQLKTEESVETKKMLLLK
jgi:hypothetical protein